MSTAVSSREHFFGANFSKTRAQVADVDIRNRWTPSVEDCPEIATAIDPRPSIGMDRHFFAADVAITGWVAAGGGAPVVAGRAGAVEGNDFNKLSASPPRCVRR